MEQMVVQRSREGMGPRSQSKGEPSAWRVMPLPPSLIGEGKGQVREEEGMSVDGARP